MTSETPTAPMPPIVIEPHQWEELAAILRAHLPERRVWAFGSRATGLRVRRFSDLDLAVGGEELNLRDAALLDEALDESRLPFKVDVVQLATLTPEFRVRIEPEMVLVQEPENTSRRNPKPNKLTLATMRKTAQGKEVHRSKNAASLYRKLGI
jgi:predicted nucleotidyltransferase